ncbi:MAG: RagB/SusD family nutrient uptake outer membrane protein, partial [Odoribacter sp.]|nr:RagB/SusD family nutrient uptake outer membrane protein [Odoribacter sp.]
MGLSVSCSDWLDVRPKSEIIVDEHFESEEGFFDQLIGVYTSMSSVHLYGREMTFGLMEVLSQDYDLNAGNVYYDAVRYDYNSKEIKERIDTVWSMAYNAIVNLNIMLEYIDKVDRNMFKGNNYAIYKGEALGLRAFLHFDMLRIFAPSYASNPSAPTIPYVTDYSTKVTPQSTVSEVLDLVIKDLEQATDLLKADPIYSTSQDSVYLIRANRQPYFNYYAAKATMARAYLWKGDKENAYKCASEIIEANRFNWVASDIITTVNTYERDITFTAEHIFRLEINKMSNEVSKWFYASSGNNKLSPSEIKMQDIYEYSKGYGVDYRYSYLYQYDGENRYFAKFWQYTNTRYPNKMPLIRKAEVYYIAAEAIMEVDSELAIEYLNEVCSNRNLRYYPLSSDLSIQQIDEEIEKEYRKELLGEGQYFLYYKRLNKSTIPGSAIS